jgi:hypothetical protein
MKNIQMNTPYLAFVALKDIPAGTELTFDYDPGGSRSKKRGRKSKGDTVQTGYTNTGCKPKGRPGRPPGSKNKSSQILPPGMKPCMCGEKDVCRGWVRF